MYRKVFSILSLVLVLAMALSVVAPAFAQSGKGGGKGLSNHNRELLIEARVKGAETVVVLIVSAPGANRVVASGVTRLGGTVRYQEDSINYISAIVPIDQSKPRRLWKVFRLSM